MASLSADINELSLPFLHPAMTLVQASALIGPMLAAPMDQVAAKGRANCNDPAGFNAARPAMLSGARASRSGVRKSNAAFPSSKDKIGQSVLGVCRVALPRTACAPASCSRQPVCRHRLPKNLQSRGLLGVIRSHPIRAAQSDFLSFPCAARVEKPRQEDTCCTRSKPMPDAGQAANDQIFKKIGMGTPIPRHALALLAHQSWL